MASICYFDKSRYQQLKAHEAVKNKVVEDVEIMRYLKSKNHKGHFLLGNGFLSCRMYKSYDEAVNGFSKNFQGLFYNSKVLLSLFIFFVGLGWLFVMPSIDPQMLFVCLCLILYIRIMISILANQSIIKNIIWHPLNMFNLCFIAMRSMYVNAKNINQWKGRKIS